MATKTDSKNKKVKNAVVAPSKKTMNFAHHESNFNPKRFLIVALVLVAVIAIFAKVGILDQLEKKSDAYQELKDRQTQLAAIQKKLSGYKDLEKEYGRYSYGWMDDNEVSMVSRMDVLGLVEREIFPYAIVEDMAVNDNVLTLNVRDITLEQASEIIMSLEEDDLVKNAYLYYAEAEHAEEALISMSIILTKEVSGT